MGAGNLGGIDLSSVTEITFQSCMPSIVPDYIHTPVLPAEVLQYLAPRSGGVYCDCTLGGAGHTRSILDASQPNGRVLGIDRDPAAISAAKSTLEAVSEPTRATLVHGRFGNVRAILAEAGIERVDGFLVDLGPSSPQFDWPDRGFSFLREGPLDMRMDPTTGETALDLIRHLSPDELAGVLRELGEERYASRIAGRAKQAYRDGELRTTTDLAKLVEDAIPAAQKRRAKTHPATKTFQALRIAVNREIDELEEFLSVFPDLLAPGGRCVVISFHSLEDRRVKQRFRELAWSSRLPPDLARKAGERVHPVCRIVTRKAIFATPDEVAANPRARSARLRACEKLEREL